MYACIHTNLHAYVNTFDNSTYSAECKVILVTYLCIQVMLLEFVYSRSNTFFKISSRGGTQIMYFEDEIGGTQILVAKNCGKQ